MAADTDWPEVESGLLGHFRAVFKSPLHVDAAFDTEDECDSLVLCSFPDILDEARLDTVALLMNWKELNGRFLTRMRRSIVEDNLFRLHQPDVLTVQEQFQHLTKTRVRCILEMHSKRKQRKYKEDPPQEV